MDTTSPIDTYIVAGVRTWNRRIFDEEIGGFPGKWVFTDDQDQLTPDSVARLNPQYVFFLHWPWRVPTEVVDKYECVCFHMTDVPYGRGGSPLQNLIVRGHRRTRLSALRMVHELDAGPVYLKEDLSLEGSAEEIYLRATRLSMQLIMRIIREHPTPVPQEGEIVVFKRRRPEESMMPELGSIESLHDFVRMLDAEGYPRAFLLWRGFRFEFSRATLYNGRVEADVTITKCEQKDR
jgi:methionyl-tRNA formyltransferase